MIIDTDYEQPLQPENVCETRYVAGKFQSPSYRLYGRQRTGSLTRDQVYAEGRWDSKGDVDQLRIDQRQKHITYMENKFPYKHQWKNYFVAKYDTSSVLEEKHNYIQAGDRQLLTAKRSLEKEKEEWSSLLHWAVLHILGGGQTCTN